MNFTTLSKVLAQYNAIHIYEIDGTNETELGKFDSINDVDEKLNDRLVLKVYASFDYDTQLPIIVVILSN